MCTNFLGFNFCGYCCPPRWVLHKNFCTYGIQCAMNFLWPSTACVLCKGDHHVIRIRSNPSMKQGKNIFYPRKIPDLRYNRATWTSSKMKPLKKQTETVNVNFPATKIRWRQFKLAKSLTWINFQMYGTYFRLFVTKHFCQSSSVTKMKLAKLILSSDENKAKNLDYGIFYQQKLPIYCTTCEINTEFFLL